MKKNGILLTLIILFVVIFTFSACIDNGETTEGEKKQIVSVSVSVPDKDFVIGQIDFSEIILIINYNDGSNDYYPLSEDMIADSDKALLTQAGMRQLKVIYKGFTTKMSLNLVNPPDVYYTVTITGGYVSAVNGTTLVAPYIPADGEDFSEQYVSGTRLTIHWKDTPGRFFDYWTLNDIKSAESSIIDITVNDNVHYRAYTGAVVNTVSFVTGFDSLNVKSKTTDILNESDIEEIKIDGYVFLGWTTDEITQEQAHSAYQKNIISFPYDVTRDTVLYGVWTPIGITYKDIGDAYAVTSFSGDIKNLVIPETYNGKPVKEISSNAFISERGRELVSVTLPAGVSIIGEGAFRECSHLEEILINGKSDYFLSEQGVLYSVNKRTLVAYPPAKTDAVYYIAAETTAISSYAFYDASLGGIVLGSGINSIGRNAFDSEHIDYVDFYYVNPTGLTVGNELFHDNLSKIHLLSGRKEAFCGFSEFSAVSDKIITDSTDITEIGVFETTEADGLISRTVYRVISDENFENKGATAEIISVSRNVVNYTLQIYLGGYEVSSIAEDAFASCDYLSVFRIPAGSRLERIGDGAFDNTPWINSLSDNAIIANFVYYKYFGSDEKVKLENGIEKIAEGAFSGNSSLKYLDITSNATLTDIAAYAFYNCRLFNGFIYSDAVDSKTVYLKKNIENVGAYAFYGTKINDVVLQKETAVSKNSWKSIGEYAFAYCDELISVQISAVMSSISPEAFIGCYALKEFILTEENKKYEIYDGILYEKLDNGYELKVYPAGRMDTEFNPASLRNYALSLTRDENLYFDSNQIGTIIFNGKTYLLYMDIVGLDKTQIERTSGDEIKLIGGDYLLETTDVEYEDGSLIPNGQKYYYIFDEDNGVSKKIVLLYDKERDNYYFEKSLNVTKFGDYSLHYSNIAAIVVTETVIEISEFAVNIPGLMYIRFVTNPVADYAKIFAYAEPKYVVLPDSEISVNNKKKFYGNDEALMASKDKNESPYTFFYNYDEFSKTYDKNVLYAYEVNSSGTIGVSIVRTSRLTEEVFIPTDIVMNDYKTSEVIYFSEKKKITSYAFFGAKLKTVYLRLIEEIESNAFSMAYNMTKLDLNTDFISNLGEDVFGSLFDNGLYIHDYINGADLYRASAQWGMDFFRYTTPDGFTRYASKYLIENENGAFAVIVFDNGGKLETVEIKYSNITVEEVSEIQKSITKVGYDISQWTDNEGNVINADVDYAIPYNQILECNFVPQTYEIYLYASPSVGFDFEIVSQDESGLIKYRTNITYDDNYSFEPTKNPDGKYVFWRMTDGSRISSEGIWRIVAENGAELRADFGYKLNYDLNNENVSPDFEIITEYVFNGSAYELGVPETSDGRRFIGWSLSKNGDSMITDETGRGLSNWTETTSNDYTVYAIWE